ncbi:MAG: TIGR02300 family protein [Parvibaculaceae bacterium]|jgi:uncharacterized protein (TIGR02300 family)|nr:TIGR02300 family protein [Parvibaculaceae bacterium]|tara:strand:- start:88 stop:525 length:438 start_codon:yes stop_codon:yes gene_type:complete
MGNLNRRILGVALVSQDLGTKRVCSSCSAKFYDLNKDPIICPKCGFEEAVNTGRAKRKTAEATNVAPERKKAAAADESADDESDEEDTSLDALAAKEEAGNKDDDEDDDFLDIDDDDDDDTFLDDDEEDDDDVADLIPGLDDDDD